MNVFPAIDIYDNKVVRLKNGDFDKISVYGDNPLEIAKYFYSCGAKNLHIVDLNGAKTGKSVNFNSIIKIKNNLSMFCEVGGGIRNRETSRNYINSGVDRIIIGTAAISDQIFLRDLISDYGEKIAVGLDIKNNNVAVNGWIENSFIDPFVFFKQMIEIGVKNIICTDISRDGMMEGSNIELYKSLVNLSVNLIASGGVSDYNDVFELKRIGINGVIIGNAIYTGVIDLKELLRMI